MDLLKLEEFFEYFKNIDPNTYHYHSISSKGWQDTEYRGKYCIAGHASIWAGFCDEMLSSVFAKIFNIDENTTWNLVYMSGDQADTHEKAVKFLRAFIDKQLV